MKIIFKFMSYMVEQKILWVKEAVSTKAKSWFHKAILRSREKITRRKTWFFRSFTALILPRRIENPALEALPTLSLALWRQLQSFWVRGYYVSNVGRDEKMIRDYICNEEAEDRRLDQGSLLR